MVLMFLNPSDSKARFKASMLMRVLPPTLMPRRKAMYVVGLIDQLKENIELPTPNFQLRTAAASGSETAEAWRGIAATKIQGKSLTRRIRRAPGSAPSL
jgi:hypothetical protein